VCGANYMHVIFTARVLVTFELQIFISDCSILQSIDEWLNLWKLLVSGYQLQLASLEIDLNICM